MTKKNVKIENITIPTIEVPNYDYGNSQNTLDADLSLRNLANVAKSGAYTDLTGTPTLATVATSGDYSDLSGTPTLSTVATSGDYDDLINKPTTLIYTGSTTISTTNSYTITGVGFTPVFITFKAIGNGGLSWGGYKTGNYCTALYSGGTVDSSTSRCFRLGASVGIGNVTSVNSDGFVFDFTGGASCTIFYECFG